VSGRGRPPSDAWPRDGGHSGPAPRIAAGPKCAEVPPDACGLPGVTAGLSRSAGARDIRFLIRLWRIAFDPRRFLGARRHICVVFGSTAPWWHALGLASRPMRDCIHDVVRHVCCRRRTGAAGKRYRTQHDDQERKFHKAGPITRCRNRLLRLIRTPSICSRTCIPGMPASVVAMMPNAPPPAIAAGGTFAGDDRQQ
jgi:hypothetical protein